ncbi:hypothetical protein GCM10009682_57650 [Luedemannella flava]|uniref:Uncharacterized protein n=1 Tax=Luedemannella flava TaxID=349316 RepID=A0ABP4YUN8_9ACTN
MAVGERTGELVGDRTLLVVDAPGVPTLSSTDLVRFAVGIHVAPGRGPRSDPYADATVAPRPAVGAGCDFVRKGFLYALHREIPISYVRAL